MLRHIARHARTALGVPRYYVGGLGKRLMTDPVFLWAQAIAFKTLVTLLPLILLATGVFGLVLRQDDPFKTIATFLRSFLPAGQSGALVELVFELQKASGTITFVGGTAFFVTVITLFSTLRYVVGMASGESRHRMRSIGRGYLFDLRMMAQVGSLFLISFGLTLGVRLLSARGARLAALLGLDPSFGAQAGQFAVQAVALVVPYVLTVGMLAQLYYFVPRPRPPARSALVGAAVAAVLFEGAKNGFALYATHVGDFDRYAAADAALGGLGGVFGLILAFVFWVYLSGLILIVGAMVTGLHERRHRPRRSTLRRLWSQVGAAKRRTSADPTPACDAAAEEAGEPAEPSDPPAVGDGAVGDGAVGQPEPAAEGTRPAP